MKHQIITSTPESVFSVWNDQEIVHVVEFDSVSVDEITAIRKWCHDTYGASGLRLDSMYTRWRDMAKIGRIYFAREEDVGIFMMKWSDL